MQILRILSLSSLVALALQVGQAGQARADVAAPTLLVEKTKLGNGLEVILHEDHRTPIVTVNVWYHVGSKDEPQGKNGFAHLFEHVMFQGSKHIPEDAYFRFLERSGATDVNGTTALDRTNYFETVPANRLELALWMESDRMGFLLSHVDQATFESQREVVKNERRQNYENAPYGLVFQYINERLYPANHPYHLLTIGTPKDLDAASLADVKAFFRTWYLPNNATVVVAGDIDKAKTKALVEKYFGPIPAGTLPARNPVPEAKITSEVHLDVVAGVELPRVYLSWLTPKMFAPGDAELDLVARVLSGGKTSRLYKRLVYDMQIAQDVSAYQGSGQLGSSFQIMATAQPGHSAAQMLQAIDEELATLKSAGLREGELARARTAFTSGLIFDIERDGARANMINTYNQLAGDPGYLPKDLARYATATDAAVLDAAKQWLSPTQRIVTIVTPTKGAPIAGVLNAQKGAAK